MRYMSGVNLIYISQLFNIFSDILTNALHFYIPQEELQRISLMSPEGIDLLGDILEASVYSINPDYGSIHNRGHFLISELGNSVRHFMPLEDY